jgi:hypothetical protein
MAIDIQHEFANSIRNVGGTVLDDMLQGAIKPSNADYWFPEDQVVLELKCLSDNLMKSTEFNRRISDLYSSWVKRGLVHALTQHRTTINLGDLPEECSREFLDPIKRRLDVNIFKKANHQIKSIKKYFDVPHAKGLLVVANDGDYSLPPQMMRYFLNRSMRSQYSAINSVIYFSANVKVRVPGLPYDTLFWVESVLPRREPVRKEFRKKIRDAWMSRHSELIPDEYLLEYELKPNTNTWEGIKFTKK